VRGHRDCGHSGGAATPAAPSPQGLLGELGGSVDVAVVADNDNSMLQQLQGLEGDDVTRPSTDEELGRAELTGSSVDGSGGLETDKGGSGLVTSVDQWLEAGWGIALACSSSRGDGAGKRLTVWSDGGH
jgi:hypothetical protein